MIKINLKDIKTFGYHGVYEDERKFGQNFFINLSYTCKKNKFIQPSSDNINYVLDYIHVIKIVKKFIEAKDSGFKKYFLLEKLIEDLHSYLTQEFKDYDFKCIFLSITKIIDIDGRKQKINVEKIF